MLSVSVYLFESDSSYGPNQIALILSAGIATIVAIKNGYLWNDILDAIVQSIGTEMGALLIFLLKKAQALVKRLKTFDFLNTHEVHRLKSK